jgi:hypothetical protein
LIANRPALADARIVGLDRFSKMLCQARLKNAVSGKIESTRHSLGAG